jgi:hypothetical protein
MKYMLHMANQHRMHTIFVLLTLHTCVRLYVCLPDSFSMHNQKFVYIIYNPSVSEVCYSRSI